MVLTVVPPILAAFSAANASAAELISASGSVDSFAHSAAAAAALGPIGAQYLAAYIPAQSNNLAGTLLVASVHEGIATVTEASRTSFLATDAW